MIFVAYLLPGGLFALAFAAKGIDRVDPAAKGSGIGFRLAVLPGVILLWPFLLSRWIAVRRLP